MLDIKELYHDRHLDPRWDNKLFDYDLTQFDWPTLFTEHIQSLYPQVTDLTKLHQTLDTKEMISLRKHLERFCRSADFQSRVDSFVKHVIKGKFDHDDYMIQSTPGLRIVVPNQAHKNRLLNFHTGYWTGYDNGTMTIWNPITPAFDTNTMQVTDWATSRDLMERIHKDSWKLDRIQKECESVSWPVKCDVGQSWLFQQGHLHGNVNNETGQTRLSFDVRVASKDVKFGRRRPGSYYRFPNVNTQLNKDHIDRDRIWIAFVSPNDPYIDQAPYFMIREYLLQWCKQLDIQPNEWSNEYHDCEWMPKFKDYISKKNTGIVFASIYNFSISPEERIECFKEAINNNIQMLFCDENLLVRSVADLELIERYYQFYYHQA